MADEMNVNTGIADSGSSQETQAANTSTQETSTQETQASTSPATQGIAEPSPTPENRGIADSETSIKEQSKAQEPAVYDYELKANEGEDLGFYNKLCKECRMTKTQAEKFLEGLRSQNRLDIETSRKEQMAQAKATINAWQTEINNDADFGGKAWATTCHNARRAFDAFDEDGGIQEMLRVTGYQHNPKIIRAIARVGAAMGEDRYIGSNGKHGGEELSLAERMYPGMNKKGE